MVNALTVQFDSDSSFMGKKRKSVIAVEAKKCLQLATTQPALP